MAWNTGKKKEEEDKKSTLSSKGDSIANTAAKIIQNRIAQSTALGTTTAKATVTPKTTTTPKATVTTTAAKSTGKSTGTTTSAAKNLATVTTRSTAARAGDPLQAKADSIIANRTAASDKLAEARNKVADQLLGNAAKSNTQQGNIIAGIGNWVNTNITPAVNNALSKIPGSGLIDTLVGNVQKNRDERIAAEQRQELMNTLQPLTNALTGRTGIQRPTDTTVQDNIRNGVGPYASGDEIEQRFKDIQAKRQDLMTNIPDEKDRAAYSSWYNQTVEAGLRNQSENPEDWETWKLEARQKQLTAKKEEEEAKLKADPEAVKAEHDRLQAEDKAYQDLYINGLYDWNKDRYITGRPEDYNDWDIIKWTDEPSDMETYYDGILYDSIHGTGAYQDIIDNGTNEDLDRADAEIQDLWDRLENGNMKDLAYNDERRARLLELEKMTATGVYQSQELDRINRELSARKTAQGYRDRAAGMDAVEADPNLNKGVLNQINPFEDPADASYRYAHLTDDELGMYQGTALAANTVKKVGAAWIPGAMFTDDMPELPAEAFIDPEDREVFDKLYMSGDKAAATAFMESLKETYLNQRRRDYLQQQHAEAAEGALGGLAGLATVPLQLAGGVKATLNNIPRILMGDKDAADPLSTKWQDMNLVQDIRSTRSNVWEKAAANGISTVGDLLGQGADKLESIGAKPIADIMRKGEEILKSEGAQQAAGEAGAFLYGMGMSMADNLVGIAAGGGQRGALNMISEGITLAAMGTSAAANTTLTELNAGKSPLEAALLGIANGGIQTLTEIMPTVAYFDVDPNTIMQAGKKAMRDYLLKNAGAEAFEEGVGAIGERLMDGIISAVFGHESDAAKRQEEIYQQLMRENPGIDPTVARQQAAQEEFKEFAWDAVKQMASGGLSGGLMAGGSVANMAYNQYQTGRTIRNAEEVRGKTGTEQLVDAALGMNKDTLSYKIASELKKAQEKGVPVSDYQIGRLAMNVYNETSQSIGNVARDIVLDQAKASIQALGVKNADAPAAAIAKAVVEGMDSLSKSERAEITGSDAAMTVMQGFMQDRGQQLAAEVKVAQETAKARSIRETVNQLTSGKAIASAASGAVRDSYRKAEIADPTAIMAASGKRSVGVMDALQTGVDGTDRAVTITAINKDGTIKFKTENGTENVDAGDVVAGSAEVAALLRFAKTNTGLITNSITDANGKNTTDYSYVNAVLQEIAKNGGKQQAQAASFLDDAIKIRMRAFSEGAMPKTNIGTEAAQALWTAAKSDFDAMEAQRTAVRTAIKENAGTMTFMGGEYGSKRFEEQIKRHLTKSQQNEARVLGEISKRMGFQVELINDTDNTDIFGWEDRGTGKITINMAGDDGNGNRHSIITTAAHEMTHWIEQNSREGYAALREYVFDGLRKQGVDVDGLIMNKMESYAAAGQDVDMGGAIAEIVADSCGEVLGSETMAAELKKVNPNLYSRVKEFVRTFVDRAKEAFNAMRGSSSYEARQLRSQVEELSRIWLSAKAEGMGAGATGTAAEDTGTIAKQFSRKIANGYDYTKSFNDQITDSINGIIPERDSLLIGGTPQVFLDIGIPNLPTTINQQHVGYAIKGNYPNTNYRDGHIFSQEEYSKLPDKMAHPVAIIQDPRRSGEVIVYVEMNNITGKPVIVPYRIGTVNSVGGKRINVNRAKSVFADDDGLNVLESAIKRHTEQNPTVYYLDDKKALKYPLGNDTITIVRSGLSGLISKITNNPNYVKPQLTRIASTNDVLNNITKTQKSVRQNQQVKQETDKSNDVRYSLANKRTRDYLSMWGRHRVSEYQDMQAKILNKYGLKESDITNGNVMAEDRWSALGISKKDQAQLQNIAREMDRWENYRVDAMGLDENDLGAQYVEAWYNGDRERMDQILMEKMTGTDGVIPYKAPHWYSGEMHQWVSNAIKEGNEYAIKVAATEMANLVPKNAVLVPMPPHTGVVTDTTDTMLLAKQISELTGRPVITALEGVERQSRKASKEGAKSRQITAEDMGFRQVADLPEGTIPIFIDNVVGSGVTAQAAHNALGQGVTLAYAKSTRAAMDGLKNAAPTYYDPQQTYLIPLEDRFDMSQKGVKGTKYAVRDQAYQQAVESGDTTLQQMMVDEAAKAAGYTDKAYHGTRNFGFTEFNLDKGQGTIFVAYDKDISKTYADNADVRNVGNKNTYGMTAEQLSKELQRIGGMKYDNKDINSAEYVPQEKLRSRVDKAISVALNGLNGLDWKDTASTRESIISEAYLQSGVLDKGEIERFTSVKNLAEYLLDRVKSGKMRLINSSNILSYILRAGINSNKNISATERAKMGILLYDLDQYYKYAYLPEHKDGSILIKAGEINEEYIISKEKAADIVQDRIKNGIYQLYTKPGRQLIVDADNRRWNGIEFNLYGWEKRGDDLTGYRYVPTDYTWDENFNIEDYDNGEFDKIPKANTRNVAAWAKAHGYDSVRINNVHDSGTWGAIGHGSIGIFFNPNDIKSADAVTYDEDGNVIPLSERFKADNNDIRYSVRENDAEELRLRNEMLEASDAVNELREKSRSMKPELNAWVDRITEARDNGTLDEVMKEYKEWEKGYNAQNDALYEAEQRRKETQKAYDDYRERVALEEERKQIEASGLSEADYRRKEAVKEFGYTTNYKEAGYLLPNGKMLNFSGEKGKHFGYRAEDHRRIGTVYASYEMQGGAAMMAFMRDGNIRVMAETPGIDICTSAEPTAEQYSQIKNMAARFASGEYFNVDLTDERGYNVGSIEYDGNVNPSRVVNDIKSFFRTGEVPQQSTVSQFHYAVRNAMDMDVATWMESLSENQMQTEAEKKLLQDYKALRMKQSLNIKRQSDTQNKISKLENYAKERELTQEEKRELSALKIKLQNAKDAGADIAEQLYQVTSSEGYAGLMYQQSKVMDDYITGKTQGELNEAVDDMTRRADEIQARLQKQAEELGRIAESAGVQRVRSYLGASSLREMAGVVKKAFGSTISNKELEAALAEIALKRRAGEPYMEEVQNLAGRVMETVKGERDSDLARLRGTTITISEEQLQEMIGQRYNMKEKLRGLDDKQRASMEKKIRNEVMKELRGYLAGTGIKIAVGERSTLVDDLSNFREEFGAGIINEDAGELDVLDEFLKWVQKRKEQSKGSAQYQLDPAEVIGVIIGAANNVIYKEGDTKADRDALAEAVTAMQGEVGNAIKAINGMMKSLDELRKSGHQAQAWTAALQRDAYLAIGYYNKIARMAQETAREKKLRDTIAQLKSEAAQKLAKNNEEWRELIARDKQARETAEDIGSARRKIHTDVSRLYKLLSEPKGLKNIPEHLQGLARELIRIVVDNDLSEMRHKISNVSKKQLEEVRRRLDAWEDQSGAFNYNADNDDPAMERILMDMMDIRDHVIEWNKDIHGKNKADTLRIRHEIISAMQEAVTEVYSYIRHGQDININNKQIAVEDAADAVREGTGGKKYREWTGKAGRVISGMHKAIVSGNMTPEYFFRNLGNKGLSDLWEGYHEAENRNGLELAKAKDRLAEIAEKHGYKNWDMNQKITLPLDNGPVTVTLGQLMSLYATWKRENTLGPEMSEHLYNGGFYAEQDLKEGVLGRTTVPKRAHRVVWDEETGYDEGVKFGQLLTDEQRAFVDEVVGFLSDDMSKLGNEASMKAYGIKMYKEKYYFPFQTWDGVKARKSSEGAAAAGANDRAFYPSFSKSRMHGAGNALVIGDFMQTAADHVAGMINYATMGLANENLQKVLNYSFEEGEPGNTTKRNVRAMLEEAYGREAMQYLAELQKQLNGGAVKVEKSMYDRLLSMFRKNAVAGSMSVAMQQPLSYIRAAVMISPKYLARALSLDMWKGSYKEMLQHSGVAVIKEMGRFDMNAGQTAREYLMPDAKQTGIQKAWNQITDKMTILPEKMDAMTWTRMWSAVKAEQKALHPEMDVKSDEFLDMCGERFNDIMRRTQVYDSTLVRSENMRSQNQFKKSITSFMAEPTLTLNVLADAVRMAKNGEKGGVGMVWKAGATFIVSAILQAAVKAAFRTGRSPEEKKTWAEQYINALTANMISEMDPMQLIPGYSDLVELLKEGKLQDDAMGIIGKFFTAKDSVTNLLLGDSKDPWRDVEDSVGQIVQLFTNLPAKNLSREARAIYNWATGTKYAQRDTSGAVLKYQALDTVHSADNLLGVINNWLGAAGYETGNKAYYQRIYDARKAGDQAKADEMTEYLVSGRGVKPETINTQMNTLTKADENLSGAEKVRALMDNGYKTPAAYVKDLYSKGELTRNEAEKLYAEASPKAKDKDIHDALDEIDYEQATGREIDNYTNYTPLYDAMDAGDDKAIQKRKAELVDMGYKEKDILSSMKSYIKKQYKEGELTRAEAEAQLKKYDPSIQAKDMAKMLDEIDYEEETGQDVSYSNYTPLFDAINAGNSTDIRTARAKLKTLGYKDSDIDTEIGGYIRKQYQNGEITRAQAESRLAQYSGLSKDDAWWALDRVDYQKKTGKNPGSGKYYRLYDAIESNKSADISAAVGNMLKYGLKKENIKKQLTTKYKDAYLAADSAGKVKLKNAIELAYKALGYTTSEADKTINSWGKTKKKGK